MLSEAVKKQFLSSREYYFVKRWEGKPWSFKFKYLLANYPEMLLCGVCAFVVAPILVTLKVYFYPNSYKEAIQKYNMMYTVVRDDDPNIENIKKIKEMGRGILPDA